MKALALTLVLLVATPSPTVEPLRPSAVLSPPGGPRIVLLNAKSSPVVSMRLSVPFSESSIEAGTGGVLQELALERVRPVAAQFGGRFDAARTPWGVAYTATGAAADFDHLAGLLRAAVAEPTPGRLRFQRARDRVMRGVDRDLETPGGLLRIMLLDRVTGGAPPLYGSPRSLSALTIGSLRDFWARSHQRATMSLVVVGSIPQEAILAAFVEVGAPQSGLDVPLSAPLPEAERPRTQALRTWYGRAHAAGTSGDPRVAVAALLIGERVASGPSEYELGVELWETGAQLAITITGAAHRRQVRAMRQAVRGLLAETEAHLTEATVAAAVSRVRTELLTAGRSHHGLVRVVGRHFDASGDPEEAANYLDALGGLDRGAMLGYLQELQAGQPFEAEVLP